MLLINPSNVIFETKYDIVDYVSKGLPPRKKDFEKVMNAIHQRPAETPGDEVSIDPSMFIINVNEFEDVLRRIYENNCRKRNIILLTVGIATLALIGVKIANHAKEKKEQEEFDAAVDRFLVEHPGITVDDM